MWSCIYLIITTCIILLLICLNNRAKAEIKKGLARDLHDDLGSNIASIKLFTELAARQNAHEHYIHLINKTITETNQIIRNLIWLMDEDATDLQSLISRLRASCIKLAEGNNISLNLPPSEILRKIHLNDKEKRNLLMIMKEAVINAIKYSSCTAIYIKISIRKARKFIIIEDNGSGLPKNMEEGNGFSNMKQRALNIHYALKIKSTANGTLVMLKSSDFLFKPSLRISK